MQYQTIPREDVDDEEQRPENPRARKARRIRRGAVATVICIAVALFTYGVILGTAPVIAESCDTVGSGYECKTSISRNWGQYSPYFSVPSEISTELPSTCPITFAQILSRHGARDPTAHKTVEYAATMAKIRENVKASSYKGKFAFLKDYQYRFGADQLSTFGQQQLVNSGIKFYQRYEALSKNNLPFVRASGQERVVESAQNFTQGFHLARTHDGHGPGHVDADWPYSILVIPEGPESNNTLDHSRCTAFETGAYSGIGEDSQEKWAAIFVPAIASRINRKLPGADLSSAEVLHFMDMCPFDTVAHPVGKVSPFCGLFTKDEWESYGYYQSLGKYYGFGDGNPLGPSNGVGFANELIARMTNSAVVDHTSSNTTLDSDPETFPLDAKLYADFSHDNDLTSAFAALNLYELTTPLEKKHRQTPQENQGYSASWTVPFAGRAYFEKMKCDDQEEELVRVIVNDRVMPLSSCGGDEYGRCTLSNFIDSLGFAKNGGKWAKCFKSKYSFDLVAGGSEFSHLEPKNSVHWSRGLGGWYPFMKSHLQKAAVSSGLRKPVPGARSRDLTMNRVADW